MCASCRSLASQSEEAGTWVADPTASRERRKVHVRRGQGLASASLQSVGENPFAVMTFQPAVVPAVGDAAEKAGGAAPAASGEGPTVEVRLLCLLYLGAGIWWQHGGSTLVSELKPLLIFLAKLVRFKKAVILLVSSFTTIFELMTQVIA